MGFEPANLPIRNISQPEAAEMLDMSVLDSVSNKLQSVIERFQQNGKIAKILESPFRPPVFRHVVIWTGQRSFNLGLLSEPVLVKAWIWPRLNRRRERGRTYHNQKQLRCRSADLHLCIDNFQDNGDLAKTLLPRAQGDALAFRPYFPREKLAPARAGVQSAN